MPPCAPPGLNPVPETTTPSINHFLHLLWIYYARVVSCDSSSERGGAHTHARLLHLQGSIYVLYNIIMLHEDQRNSIHVARQMLQEVYMSDVLLSVVHTFIHGGVFMINLP